MADLDFTDHARQEMRRDSVSEFEVYIVVEDADEIIERHDGRTVYTRRLDDGRQVTVIVEEATQSVRTVWWNKRRGPRRR